MKDIFALRLYTRVARLGSFSAAARECGLSQSQASRIIADLEADLGTRLLSRSTRVVVPTEAGAEFLSAPMDLTKHRIVGGSAAAVPTAWVFERDDERVAVDLQPHFSTNENEAAVAAARAGLGEHRFVDEFNTRMLALFSGQAEAR
jgi:hypothetical protein